jgi:spore coat polysaccharide biosynthesis predicted glycosyltransferase SpsG
VVVGGGYPHLAALTARTAAMSDVRVRVQIDDMAATVAACDLAFGAGGVAAWERCCLGLPSVITILSQDQVVVAEALAAQGAAVNLGRSDAVQANAYRSILARFNPACLAAMQASAMALVDGRGAERAAAAMLT